MRRHDEVAHHESDVIASLSHTAELHTHISPFGSRQETEPVSGEMGHCLVLWADCDSQTLTDSDTKTLRYIVSLILCQYRLSLQGLPPLTILPKQVCPLLSQLCPLLSVFCPLSSQVCPHLWQLCPHLSQLCPDLSQLCPDLWQYCPPLSQVCLCGVAGEEREY